jgi:hypothetical protein
VLVVREVQDMQPEEVVMLSHQMVRAGEVDHQLLEHTALHPVEQERLITEEL